MKTEEPPIPPSGMLKAPLPLLRDPEGSGIPESLPRVVDAHVHLFPDGVFASIWQWFDRFGWPIRYKFKANDVVGFLLSRGIGHIIALHYAHRPGVSRELNSHMADLCRRYPQVTGMATVFPGEEKAGDILEEGFSQGLAGVKLHAHVQCFDLAGAGMGEVYEICESSGKPLVMHVGREPKSPAYHCDPYALCSASKLERVIREHPRLKVCVPHLGADEFSAYLEMIERYDNIWLDTTMMLAEYLPGCTPPHLGGMRPDRIMYGTDFPNIPYAWDRELTRITRLGLPGDSLARILGGNAAEFYALKMQSERIPCSLLQEEDGRG
jgi:uncharacterized protein